MVLLVHQETQEQQGLQVSLECLVLVVQVDQQVFEGLKVNGVPGASLEDLVEQVSLEWEVVPRGLQDHQVNQGQLMVKMGDLGSLVHLVSLVRGVNMVHQAHLVLLGPRVHQVLKDFVDKWGQLEPRERDSVVSNNLTVQLGFLSNICELSVECKRTHWLLTYDWTRPDMPIVTSSAVFLMF